MAGCHGIISNKLNKKHSKSPRKWNSAFTSSIPNCTQNRGQMVTGVWMNYQPKQCDPPPPTHTHTLFQGFVPWVSSRVLLWIDSNLSICKSTQSTICTHTSLPPPTKWVPFFMIFWLIPMWLFSHVHRYLSFPDFGIVHTTGHYLRRCLVLPATSTNPHVAWFGCSRCQDYRDILLKRHKTLRSEDSGGSFG